MPCHSYIFFNTLPSFATVSKSNRDEYKRDFYNVLKDVSNVTIASYVTVGFKQGSYFMVHFSAPTAESIQQCIQSLMHTEFGRHLTITYALWGLVRASQYKTQESKDEKPFIDGAMKYLIVYPFTKTTDWHLLPFEERKEMMKEHVAVAKKYSSSINQLLLYSYGIDDHEFIVSYQTENLLDFQTLVMDLRNTKGRAYTQNDLPIFVCTYMPLQEILLQL